MASEDNAALASKILLMRAQNRSKVKSWLGPETEAKTEESTDLLDLKGDNENAGVGVAAVEDDPLNRQLSSANDALRKKLLSKDTYNKYQQNKSAMQPSKPMPKQKMAESDSDDEGKGKGRPAKSKTVEASQVKGKKRPGSYLDQLLAERGKKKSKG